jgi:hypothetical protein
LFAPFEKNWYWGVVYILFGVAGLAMTVHVLRPSQRARRSFAKLFIPGWLSFLLGVLPVLQWISGGNSFPNWITTALLVLLGSVFIVISALSRDQPSEPYLTRLIGRFKVTERTILYTTLAGVMLVLLFQVYSLRQDFDVYLMPRTVSDKQKAALKQALGTIQTREKKTISIIIPPNNPEASYYASQLQSAITDAGWTAIPPHSPSNNEPQLGGSGGLCLMITGGNYPTSRIQLENEIKDAFNKAGVNVPCGGSQTAGEFMIYLMVDPRPVEVNRPVSIFILVGNWLTRYWLPRYGMTHGR